MIQFPGAGKRVEERKEFRKLVRKFAEQHDLTYAMQGGAYVFSDFYLVMEDDGTIKQLTDMKDIPEGRTITRKEGSSTPTTSRKEKVRGIPNLQLHDYTLQLLEELRDIWTIQEGDTMQAFFGFHIPSLVLDTPNVSDAKEYILGVNKKLKIEATNMRVRGTGDRPEFLLIG